MTALIVVLMCVLFMGIDVAVRAVSKRMEASRTRQEREAVLKTSLTLSFADEAKSLKRAVVPEARGRILAVDDEAIVLDSFRKILVLAGFSVDTVQSGPEALTLLRENTYDFLFTDLKMPDMDGVEVVKAAKHLRPDLDIAVITGFGTIETAVATMTHGASDYVQKPFTEDELVSFANRLLIKRQARLEAESRPAVHVVTPQQAEIVAQREYCVPGGAFVSPGHAWAQIEADGAVCVGIDDFARKALGRIERVDLPAAGATVARGDVLFVLRRGDDVVRVRAPISGEVREVNGELQQAPVLLSDSPYDRGWVCVLRPNHLAEELSGLRIGAPVVAWYQGEVARLRELAPGSGDHARWTDLDRRFFSGAPASAPKPEAVSVG